MKGNLLGSVVCDVCNKSVKSVYEAKDLNGKTYVGHKHCLNGIKNGVCCSNVKATIDADWLATEVAAIIYNNGKAKIFNVLESQLPQETTTDHQKMRACKDIAVDIIGNIAKKSADFIREILGDWEVEIEAGGEVSDEDAIEAEKEYDEIQRIIR